MALNWPSKDPDEVLDYDLDWSARLATDTIATSVWSLMEGTGLIIGVNSKTNTATKVWLSGGTLAAAYVLLNRITTAGGRTMDQSVKIKIAAK